VAGAGAEPARLPPGPPGLLGAGVLAGPRFLRWCQRRYGDCFSLRLGRFGTYVYLTDPEDIRLVFRAEDTLVHAGEANAPFLGRMLGPTSVLVTDEDDHRRQRRRLSAPFHGEAVARLAPRMAAIAAADVDTWPQGQTFAVHDHMRRVTLEVILQTVIGVTDETRLEPLRAALLELTDIKAWMLAQFLFPALERRRPWRDLWERKARADARLDSEIAAARRDPRLADRSDVLALLLRPGESDGPESDFSDVELRDQIVTLLMAGHETTATGLSWALERLTRHPAVLARATDAARRGDDAYLDAVVAEALRSRPVVPDVSRRLTAPMNLGPWRLPAGAFVDPAIVVVQSDPRHYPDPERFDPDRFAGSRPDPSVWLPFGGGNRRCLGAAFAATEMRVILGEILRRVDLEPSAEPPERPRVRHVTLAPHRGGRVRVAQLVERRVAGAAPAATGP
jgi:cytochrome P450